jgi:hypothetical protein
MEGIRRVLKTKQKYVFVDILALEKLAFSMVF